MVEVDQIADTAVMIGTAVTAATEDDVETHVDVNEVQVLKHLKYRKV
jgi:hypothetical protein